MAKSNCMTPIHDFGEAGRFFYRRHINGIESFWSYAKLRLAKLRGVRWEYFYEHLKETEWRFNHRRDNLFNLLIINLRSSP